MDKFLLFLRFPASFNGLIVKNLEQIKMENFKPPLPLDLISENISENWASFIRKFTIFYSILLCPHQKTHGCMASFDEKKRGKTSLCFCIL